MQGRSRTRAAREGGHASSHRCISNDTEPFHCGGAPREHRSVGRVRVSQLAPLTGVLMLALLTGSCSASVKSRASSASGQVAVSYVAKQAERADLLWWTVAGEQVSGVIESRWIVPSDPVDLQAASVDFHGTLRGSQLQVTPADGSAVWQGLVDHSHLTLHWISRGLRFTTTFLSSNIEGFDTAVQILGNQVAAASANIANTNAAEIAVAKSRVAQAAAAARLAAHTAAATRAEAGRQSAAKAAAHRQRPHK